eukprot:2903745-Pyramimonas_sp.AAC.1
MTKNTSIEIWASCPEVSWNRPGQLSVTGARGANVLKKLGQLSGKLVKKRWHSFARGFLIRRSTAHKS